MEFFFIFFVGWGVSIFDAWSPPAQFSQILPSRVCPSLPPPPHISFYPLFSINVVGDTFQCIAKFDLLQNVPLLYTKVRILDFGHFQQFFPFLLGLKGQCTPMALLTNLLTQSCVYPWYSEYDTQVVMQQNCSLAGLDGDKNGILPFFTLFCHLGVHPQPLNFQQFILSLESHSHLTRN